MVLHLCGVVFKAVLCHHGFVGALRLIFSSGPREVTCVLFGVAMKVLAFVSNNNLQGCIAKALSSGPFVVETALSLKECGRLARAARYQAIVVGADRFTFDDVLALVVSLRRDSSDESLVVFECNLDLDQRLRLFDAGVDDCVRVPLFSSEFAVRLGISVRLRQAASARLPTGAAAVLRAGDLEMDLVRRRVFRLGKSIDLRPKEFLLLQYLVRNANRSVTRTMIIENVWQSSFEGLTNVVDVYISALRFKVDRGFPQKLIHTNRGVGYTFRTAAGFASQDSGQGNRDPGPFAY